MVDTGLQPCRVRSCSHPRLPHAPVANPARLVCQWRAARLSATTPVACAASWANTHSQQSPQHDVSLTSQAASLSKKTISSALAGSALALNLALALPAQASVMSGGQENLWLYLGGLVAANILGVQAVLAVLKKLGDRDEPISLVKVQLGLVQPSGGFGGGSLKRLRTRLAELSGMIQMGQHGLWVIVEEAVLELSAQHRYAQLADVSVVHLQSKDQAYDLFSRVSRQEVDKARGKEAAAHLAGDATCEVDWDAGDAQQPDHNSAGMAAPLAAITNWLSPAQQDTGCDDALVVTLVVAARGHLNIPPSVSSWQGVCECMKQVCGLSSDRLMAVDLTWAPSVDGSYLTRDDLVAEYAGLQPIK